ncbi:carbonic anhydrase [Acuticoccus sediminis]|uniref:Carbonic anhydrase n=1 Tax=Acuticoccus sediminis TaxID=2184697 RepID=A0A8B2NU01_9HYPH|nr:carbonic anhydrase [Acuticoccus sediminis]RAH99819.1 carbonic anhydrase [Acuticoccus sediminis]
MNDIDKLCERNQAWADRVTADDPDFFMRLSRQQRPDWFWIGCSDSRVPANQLMDLPPGEVFVHRNIANVVSPADLNFLSVLQYAVEVLRVKHVIVCGHYGCGGIRASESDKDHGLIDNWLNHIRLVKRLHAEELAQINDSELRLDRLCELNVVEQVRNVANTTIVRNAWARGQGLLVHGVVYSLEKGVLRRLVQWADEESVERFDA